MDQFKLELEAEIAKISGKSNPTGINEQEISTGNAKKPDYSHEQLMEMYQKLMKGEMPKELETIYAQNPNYLDANGKPIIDSEGGSIIQPVAGFVIKTKDNNGQKVFVNMTQHEFIDCFEEKPIP